MLIHSILIGYILDLIFGDPIKLPHPIIWIGNLIKKTEDKIRPNVSSRKGELLGGFLLMIIVVSFSFFISFFILKLASKIYLPLKFATEIFWTFQILAGKSLKTESMKVYTTIEKQDLAKARIQLSYLVGRDTQNLTEEEVIKATIETVAENTTDGMIAPLFFLFLGGVPLGFLYKAVNTLDSMVGYRNEKYKYFGRCSAYLDDILNFIPARIGGILMVLSAFILKLDGKSSFKIFIRDRYNHLSPNSAQTESAVAGALGIQLGGTHDYFGVSVEKPTIGNNTRTAICDDIKKTNHMMYLASFLALIIFAWIRYIIF